MLCRAFVCLVQGRCTGYSTSCQQQPIDLYRNCAPELRLNRKTVFVRFALVTLPPTTEPSTTGPQETGDFIDEQFPSRHYPWFAPPVSGLRDVRPGRQRPCRYDAGNHHKEQQYPYWLCQRNTVCLYRNRWPGHR